MPPWPSLRQVEARARDARARKARVDPRHRGLARSQVELGEEGVVGERSLDEPFERRGDRFGGAGDPLVLRARDDVRTQERADGALAVRQPSLALRVEHALVALGRVERVGEDARVERPNLVVQFVVHARLRPGGNGIGRLPIYRTNG